MKEEFKTYRCCEGGCSSYVEKHGDEYHVFLGQCKGKNKDQDGKSRGWNSTYGKENPIILNDRQSIPFLDDDNHSFYCGCWGWD